MPLLKIVVCLTITLTATQPIELAISEFLNPIPYKWTAEIHINYKCNAKQSHYNENRSERNG